MCFPSRGSGRERLEQFAIAGIAATAAATNVVAAAAAFAAAASAEKALGMTQCLCPGAVTLRRVNPSSPDAFFQ